MAVGKKNQKNVLCFIEVYKISVVTILQKKKRGVRTPLWRKSPNEKSYRYPFSVAAAVYAASVSARAVAASSLPIIKSTISAPNAECNRPW